MTVGEKIKTTDNKIEQNKTQFYLDRKLLRFQLYIIRKHEFLTSKDVLPKKHLLEKTTTTKIFQYSPLGNELRKQTSPVEKQYKRSDTLMKLIK